MPQRVINEGVARNVRTVPNKQEPDPSELRFVTFVNDLGSVHTIIVPADHGADDPATLLAWFNHTRTLVEHGDNLAPVEVLAEADRRTGLATGEADADPTNAEHDQNGGGS